MIAQRKRPPSKTTTGRSVMEYFLAIKAPSGGCVYRGWYTVKELEELPECPVKSTVTKERLYNKRNNPVLETVEGCAFTKKITVDNRDNARAGRKRKKVLESQGELDAWVAFNKLWPVGSLCKQARIIQGVEFT